jgi:hypothetical protein
MRVLPLLPQHPSIPLHWVIEPPQDQGAPLPLMPYKAILCYISSWSHGFPHPHVLFGWWFSPCELWDVCLVDIVVLPVGLQIASASIVLAPTSPLGSPHSVKYLAVYIHVCTGPALAEPLRRQLYWAPVSKNFLVSVIMSGFGVSKWDGSLDAAVSG